MRTIADQRVMKNKVQRMIGTAEIMMYGLMCKSFTVFADEEGAASGTSGMVESMMKDTGMFAGIIAIWQSIIGSTWGLLLYMVVGVALVYGALSLLGLIRGGHHRDMAKDNLLWIVLAVFGAALLGKVLTAILESASGV